MDASITRQEKPEQRARRGPGHHREDERDEPLVHPEELHREARGVRAHRVVEGVAEREEPAAQEEHDAEDRERLCPREGQEKRDPLGQEGRYDEEQRESHERADDDHQILRASTCPKRPWGRTSSTSAMIR